MKVFTVTEKKIRYWDKVRDMPSFKLNIEATYNITVDCYVVNHNNFDFLSLNYTNFEVSENKDEIIFMQSVYKDKIRQDWFGWPTMEYDELQANYTSEQIEQIKIAKSNYTNNQCKTWEKYLHCNIDPADYNDEIPEDFPRIPRVYIDFVIDELDWEEVARVDVTKYEA